jgi:acetylornithine deacetylase/succinyl-diaminopimelate desuccinylase-like protein
MLTKGFLAAAVLTLAAASSSPVDARDAKVDRALHERTLEILKTSIEIRSVVGTGEVVKYAEYLRSLLLDAGYAPEDISIDPVGEFVTLTARYPGRNPDKKPLLLIGHLDVVEARREDWTRDPFVAVVENGYVYGRGAYDNKFDLSVIVATLIELKRNGWKPQRDVVLALSGDEEMAMVSTRVLAERLKGAELALNGDAGGGLLDEESGEAVYYGIQAGEKTYADFKLTATDPGGHSSRPTPGNPIYRLARALARLAAYEFPIRTNSLTEAYFAASAPNTQGEAGATMKRYVANPNDREAVEQLAANPEFVGQLRTTCVVTQVDGGHAPNALPQRVTATVNCRIFPGTSFAETRQTLVDVLADPGIDVTQIDMGSIESLVSPLRPDVMKAISKVVHASHPGLPIVPSMTPGATDGMHFRAHGIPTYGVSGLYMKGSDDYSHGLDERVPVAAIDGALVHWESILRDLAK